MNIIEKTYNWNGSLKNRTSTKRIILHHAESKSCTADDIHRWHLANGWCGIGYHFFVRKDGDLKESLEVMPKDLTVILLEFALKVHT